jgi:hypothetical protein
MSKHVRIMAAAAAAGALAGCVAGPTGVAPVIEIADPVPTTVSRAADCDRACLEGMIDRYFAGVIADDPSLAPLAADVRFTENGQILPVGEGLWKSMKEAGGYRIFVTDPDAGQVALITTVMEDHNDPAQGTPSLLALRLKVEDGLITEIEQILERTAIPAPSYDAQGRLRPPQPTAAQRVEARGQPREAFLAAVPENERMSRADLIATADKYFTGMQRNDGLGDYPFGPDCDRIENGGQSTNVPTPEGQTRPDPRTSNGYSAQWTCLEQFESGLLYFVSRIRDRRWVAVDPERGLVAAFAFFDHMAGSTRSFTRPDGQPHTAGPVQPWTWEILEFFKVENGQINEIEAFLTRPPYGMQSGWSTWEDGMSDRARDVTGYTE